MSQTEKGPPRPVLEIEGLRVYFHTREGVIRAVDGVSYQLKRGETLSVVGESGCGKSVTALSILRLLPEPPGRIEGGSVFFEGRDLLKLTESEMQSIRGEEISMIFQEPMTSLNPVLTIGWQLRESLMIHKGFSRKAANDRAIELLRLVRMPEPDRRIGEYPHQLSGGMRQRVMIAMALSCNPRVLIADEPTTALDVTIQAQILELIVDLQHKMGTSVILITHDLGVVAETSQRVVVMYAGKKVEEADAESLFEQPLHPYTLGLMNSMPRLGGTLTKSDGPRRLKEIPGIVPFLLNLPPGCSFAFRCPVASEHCRRESPPLEEKRPGHWAACWAPGTIRS